MSSRLFNPSVLPLKEADRHRPLLIMNGGGGHLRDTPVNSFYNWWRTQKCPQWFTLSFCTEMTPLFPKPLHYHSSCWRCCYICKPLAQWSPSASHGQFKIWISLWVKYGIKLYWMKILCCLHIRLSLWSQLATVVLLFSHTLSLLLNFLWPRHRISQVLHSRASQIHPRLSALHQIPLVITWKNTSNPRSGSRRTDFWETSAKKTSLQTSMSL